MHSPVEEELGSPGDGLQLILINRVYQSDKHQENVSNSIVIVFACRWQKTADGHLILHNLDDLLDLEEVF